MIRKLNKNGALSALIVAFLYYLSRIIKKSPSLPSIKSILTAGIDIFSNGKFYINLAYTVKIVVLGVGISFAAGVAIAIICSMSEKASCLIMPIINSTKNIPSIALFPLFIVLMGIGDAPRIFVIIWNSAYPIISSTLKGLNSTDNDVIDAAQNCGATKWQVFWNIRIPLGLLDTLNGLKISVGNGFIAIVVAEMLGATKGLGYMILWSANAFRYPEMYVYILIIALIGLSINVVIDKLIKYTERKLFYEEKNCSNLNDGGLGALFHRLHKDGRKVSRDTDKLCGEIQDNGSSEEDRKNEVCRLESL